MKKKTSAKGRGATDFFLRAPSGEQFSVPFGQGKPSASLTHPLTLPIN
jgi:hypothetical protein